MKWFGSLQQKRALREKDIQQAEKASDDGPHSKASPKLTVGEPVERIALLTPRERDLFLLLLEGYTLKESAKQLSVKYSTVNTHMTGIYKKLNVNSRAELIIKYRTAVKGP
ncbi:MAG: response regulator transcription factor [Clostridia bacterium]|nr:response regulator transcription factor [Clostridia bacterium]